MIVSPNMPGPEVLDSFDPMEHLLDGNQGIATIPEHPDFLLRWWPRYRNQSYEPDATSASAETALCTMPERLHEFTSHADAEFRILQHLGVSSPEPDKDILRFMGDAEKVALKGLVQYSIVRRFQGAVLEATDQRGAYQIERYAEYLAQARKRGWVLWDVCKPAQHMVVPASGESPERIIIIDIEPLVTTPDNNVLDRKTRKEQPVLSYAAGLLFDWGANLGMTGSVMSSIDKLRQN